MSQKEQPISLSEMIPLHLVAGSQSPYAYFMAKALLERGSDPNSRSSLGVTPVHVAASWGNYETLKLLLLNGGDPELEDEDGKTALDLARQENRTECTQLLTWWIRNASDSKSATPASNQRSAPNQGPQSPLILDYASPTSYKPKYFTSPLSASPSSPFSPTSGGSSRRAATPKSSSSANRRVLTFGEGRSEKESREKVDGSCVGKHPGSSTELKFEKLPETPHREGDQHHGIEPRERNVSLAEAQKTASEKKTPTSAAQKKTTKTPPSASARGIKRDQATNTTVRVEEIKERLKNVTIGDTVVIHTLGFQDDGLNSFSQQLNQTLNLDDTGQREALAALEMTILEEEEGIDPKRLDECNKLTDAELRRLAINQGMDVGPITPGTRFLYVRRLASLLSAGGAGGPQKKYLPELQAAIDGRLNVVKCRQDELQLRLSFEKPVNGAVRQWREGCQKMSFCYLLLDPSVTKDLPTRSSGMSESEILDVFLDAIFYIGKGKKSRSYQHLLDAASLDPDSTPDHPKLKRIIELWRKGYGIISLHVFLNIIPVEAYSREAAMIDALGLDRLCNQKRGDYYGAAANWALGRRRRFGAYLLKLASAIFLLEGEKQLKREDVLKPTSG